MPQKILGSLGDPGCSGPLNDTGVTEDLGYGEDTCVQGCCRHLNAGVHWRLWGSQEQGTLIVKLINPKAEEKEEEKKG